jgi:hypothetical protein
MNRSHQFAGQSSIFSSEHNAYLISEQEFLIQFKNIDCDLPIYDAMLPESLIISIPTTRRNVPSPSSTYATHTLTMEAIYSSETLATSCKTKWRHKTGDSNHHYGRRDNFIIHILNILVFISDRQF